MLEFPEAALDPTMSPPSAFGVPSRGRAARRQRPGHAQSSIDRILAESEVPVTFDEQEHAGTTIHVDAETGTAYALTDDQLIFAPTADDIVAALDAHASSSTTLSEAGSITTLAAALPNDWLVFGIYDFTDLLASAFEGPAARPRAPTSCAICSRTSRCAARWPSPSRAIGSACRW